MLKYNKIKQLLGSVENGKRLCEIITGIIAGIYESLAFIQIVI
jgi:hypothetical protein